MDDYQDITVKFKGFSEQVEAKRLKNSMDEGPQHFKSPFHATINDEELADALSENVKLKMKIEELKEELEKAKYDLLAAIHE